MDFTTLTVQDLRTEARKRNLASGMTIAGASKAVLIQALTSGVWPAGAGPQDPAAALTAALAALMPAPGIDEDAVRRIVREEIPAPPTIRIQVPDRPEVEIGRQHERFPLLLQVLACGLNVLLVGPAGTGKTTAARKAAEALGLGFSCLSVGPQTSKSDLLGFVDAGGTYRESLFVQAYRDGGVFLLDEIDAGNAGVLTVLNAALAGDVMATPVGMVARSPRFLTVAGANTYGQGASRQYVGAGLAGGRGTGSRDGGSPGAGSGAGSRPGRAAGCGRVARPGAGRAGWMREAAGAGRREPSGDSGRRGAASGRRRPVLG